VTRIAARPAHPTSVTRVPHVAQQSKRQPPGTFQDQLQITFVTAALDAGVPLRDVQEAASHADPRTTMRYDRARTSLDRHATYIVAAYVAGVARQVNSKLVHLRLAALRPGGPSPTPNVTSEAARKPPIWRGLGLIYMADRDAPQG
jgi:hypothetical protein